MPLSSEVPCLNGTAVIIDEIEPDRIRFLLNAADWNTRACSLGELGISELFTAEDLVFIRGPDVRSRAKSDAIIADLRRCNSALSVLPFIALGSWEDECHVDLAIGADVHFDAYADEQELLGVISRYSCRVMPELNRLVEVFGPATMEPLVSGLRDLLRDALSTIEQNDTSLAHRIAGFAGILGLANLGAAWNDFDHGSCNAVAVARLSREAVAQLTRVSLRLRAIIGSESAPVLL